MYVTQDLPISLDSGQEPGRWETSGVLDTLGLMMGSGRTRTIRATLEPCPIRLGRMVQVRWQLSRRATKVPGALYPSEHFLSDANTR